MGKDRQTATPDHIAKLEGKIPERLVLLTKYKKYVDQFNDPTPYSGPGSPVEFDLWCKSQVLEKTLSKSSKKLFGQDPTKS